MCLLISRKKIYTYWSLHVSMTLHWGFGSESICLKARRLYRHVVRTSDLESERLDGPCCEWMANGHSVLVTYRSGINNIFSCTIGVRGFGVEFNIATIDVLYIGVETTLCAKFRFPLHWCENLVMLQLSKSDETMWIWCENNYLFCSWKFPMFWCEN